MTNDPGRRKPRFAEAMTQVRHANTVIRRLNSVSGLTPMPLVPAADPADRTMIRDEALGFGVVDPDTGRTESVTDPSMASMTGPSMPAARAPQGPLLSPIETRVVSTADVRMPGSSVHQGAGQHQGTGLHAKPDSGLHTNPGTADRSDKVHGEIIVVFGCRGGAGATTVAVNLAAELARTQKGCAVVDLDLQMGDLLCALDLQPTATIAEVLNEIDELDEASLRRRLTAHPSGLFALSQADRFDQLEALRPDRIPALIAGLSRQFGTVVIDGLRDFSDLSISALDMADRIILVVPEDVAGVKNASRCLEVFRRLGYGGGKIALVVNRHDGKAKVTPAAIAATLKIEPLAVLATDTRAAQDALDEGQALLQMAPRSPLTRTIAGLAERISRGKGAAKLQPAQSTGFLGMVRALFGGKR